MTEQRIQEEQGGRREILDVDKYGTLYGRFLLASQARNREEAANIIDPDKTVEFNLTIDALRERNYNPVVEKFSLNEREKQWGKMKFSDAYTQWQTEFTGFIKGIKDEGREGALRIIMSNSKMKAAEFTEADANQLFTDFCSGGSDITKLIARVTTTLAQDKKIDPENLKSLLPHLQWIASGLFGKDTASIAVTRLIELESSMHNDPAAVLKILKEKGISTPTDDEKKILGLLHNSFPVPQEEAPAPTTEAVQPPEPAEPPEPAITVVPAEVPEAAAVARPTQDELPSPPWRGATLPPLVKKFPEVVEGEGEDDKDELLPPPVPPVRPKDEQIPPPYPLPPVEELPESDEPPLPPPLQNFSEPNMPVVPPIREEPTETEKFLEALWRQAERASILTRAPESVNPPAESAEAAHAKEAPAAQAKSIERPLKELSPGERAERIKKQLLEIVGKDAGDRAYEAIDQIAQSFDKGDRNIPFTHGSVLVRELNADKKAEATMLLASSFADLEFRNANIMMFFGNVETTTLPFKEEEFPNLVQKVVGLNNSFRRGYAAYMLLAERFGKSTTGKRILTEEMYDKNSSWIKDAAFKQFYEFATQPEDNTAYGLLKEYLGILRVAGYLDEFLARYPDIDFRKKLIQAGIELPSKVTESAKAEFDPDNNPFAGKTDGQMDDDFRKEMERLGISL